ncbi:MAG: phosphoribosylanthranilate isomerase [Pseudohongiellaceae bacterium]
MLRTRVKICGITSVEDAKKAVDAGADAIGLVFYQPSPRAVSIIQAKAIVSSLAPFVTVVALVVNATYEFVNELLASVSVDVLQFHGDESAVFCQQFNKPYIKAIRMRPELVLSKCFTEYQQAQALLLDAYQKGVPGGTGENFDWQRIPKQRPMPIVLAGGLNPSNVQDAINTVKPYAVDVSGGVELQPGLKDVEKVNAFIKTAMNT